MIRIPPTRYATSAEQFYYKMMRRLINQLYEIIICEIQNLEDSNMRIDSFDISDETVRKIVSRIWMLNIGMLASESETIAGRFVRMLNSISSNNFQSQMKAAGRKVNNEDWLDLLMKEHISSNVAMIKNLNHTIIEPLEELLLRRVRAGHSTSQTVLEIRALTHATEDKAAFWARDQTGKILGQMNAERHKNAGIKKFKWRDSDDESVRITHKERNGKVYSYDDPPDGELPGEPYNCRCIAQPVFDFDSTEGGDDT